MEIKPYSEYNQSHYQNKGAYFAIVGFDQTVVIEQIEELYNFQDQLIEFKHKNGWIENFVDDSEMP